MLTLHHHHHHHHQMKTHSLNERFSSRMYVQHMSEVQIRANSVNFILGCRAGNDEEEERTKTILYCM